MGQSRERWLEMVCHGEGKGLGEGEGGHQGALAPDINAAITELRDTQSVPGQSLMPRCAPT